MTEQRTLADNLADNLLADKEPSNETACRHGYAICSVCLTEEIERLRAALEKIANGPATAPAGYIAREALRTTSAQVATDLPL